MHLPRPHHHCSVMATTVPSFPSVPSIDPKTPEPSTEMPEPKARSTTVTKSLRKRLLNPTKDTVVEISRREKLPEELEIKIHTAQKDADDKSQKEAGNSKKKKEDLSLNDIASPATVSTFKLV